jgi:hypothetical protein
MGWNGLDDEGVDIGGGYFWRLFFRVIFNIVFFFFLFFFGGGSYIFKFRVKINYKL